MSSRLAGTVHHEQFGNTKVRREIGAGRNFVCRWCVRLQLALVVPPQFFGRQPASALHVAAFDLAEIDGGIQRVAAVVQDIDAQQHSVLARQRIDDDLGNGRAVGKVKEGPATER